MSPLGLLYVISLCAPAAYAGLMNMYVNRMGWASVDYKWPDTYVSYLFMDGDAVDVVCVAEGSEHGLLTLSFDFRGIANGNKQSPKPEWSSDVANGFRTTLRAAHNYNSLSCEYQNNNSYTFTIHLTFVLQPTSDGPLNIKIDSVPLRYRRREWSNDIYKVWYNYIPHERIMWECTVADNFTVKASQYHHGDMKTIDGVSNDRITGNIEPDDNTTLQYEARGSGGTSILDIQFQRYLYDRIYDDTPLAFNVTHSLLELRKYKWDHLIIYNYDKDEDLVLNCSTLAGIVARYNYSLVFNDIDEYVSSYSDSIVKRFHLTLAHNHTRIGCYLKDKYNKDVRKIELLLWMKNSFIEDDGQVSSYTPSDVAEEEDQLYKKAQRDEIENEFPIYETTNSNDIPLLSQSTPNDAAEEHVEAQPIPIDNTFTDHIPVLSTSTPNDAAEEHVEAQPIPTDNTSAIDGTTNGGAGEGTGHVGAIVGGAAAGVGLVLAAVAVLYWRRKHTKL